MKDPSVSESVAGSDVTDAGHANVFDRLRKGTAEIHEQTEQRMPVFRAGFDLEDYGRLVEQFFGFWSPVEGKLSRLTSLWDPGLALASRLKSPLLREDLLFLGLDPAAAALCRKLPRLETFAQGLGCLYVLEGSTLGGQIISRRLEEHLGLRERSGASFFNAYGGLTGPRWMEFKRFVSAAVKLEEADAVVEAARETFLCFYDWLGACGR